VTCIHITITSTIITVKGGPLTTIASENDNDVILYPLEKIIFFARKNHYIFVAQCISWLASIIVLHQDFIMHIDNLKIRANIGIQEVSLNSCDLQED